MRKLASALLLLLVAAVTVVSSGGPPGLSASPSPVGAPSPSPSPSPSPRPSVIKATPSDGKTAVRLTSCRRIWFYESCEDCTPTTFRYDDVVDVGQAWRVTSRQQSENNLSGPVKARFTSTTSSTVTTSVSVEVGVTVSPAVFISVRAHINSSVTESVMTVVGNSVELPIPAGKTGIGIYGVRVQLTDGHLRAASSCGAGLDFDYGTVRAQVPLAAGWCVWLSDQPPCVVVG